MAFSDSLSGPQYLAQILLHSFWECKGISWMISAAGEKGGGSKNAQEILFLFQVSVGGYVGQAQRSACKIDHVRVVES